MLPAVVSFPQMYKTERGRKMPISAPSLHYKKPSLVPNKLLPISALLGLPIYWSSPADLQEQPPFAPPPGTLDVLENPVLKNLTIKKSTIGQGFFSSETVPGRPRSVILLARADGQKLECGIVSAPWTYVEVAMQEVNEQTDADSAHAKFDYLMRPQMFVCFFRLSAQLAKDMGDSSHLGWWHLECPVKVGCKTCGKDEGNLLRCGKCGVVKYCGKECQVSDWAAHKKICVKDYKE